MSRSTVSAGARLPAGAVLVVLSLLWLGTSCLGDGSVTRRPVSSSPRPDVTRVAAPPSHLTEELLLTLEAIESGSLDDARERTERLAQLFPQSESVALVREFLRRRLGSDPVLTAALPPVAIRDSAGAAQFRSRGRALLEINRRKRAIELFERAFALDPGSQPIRDDLVRSLKKEGLELYANGRIKDAIRRWKRVLQIVPSDLETLRFLQRAEAVRRNSD